LVRFLLREQKKMNNNLRAYVNPKFLPESSFEKRSFLCLDTNERTKGKIKAGEKIAKNFYASLKQIKYALLPRCKANPYLFFNAPLQNFFNAVFSHAVFLSC
jgi:hypothetical protein